MPKGQTYQAGSVAINLGLNSAQFSAALDAAKNSMAKAQKAMSASLHTLSQGMKKMGTVIKTVTSGIVSDLSAIGGAFKSLAQSAITPSAWIKGFLGVSAAILACTGLAVQHRREMENIAATYKHTNKEMSAFTYIAASTGIEYEKLADTLREVQVKANDIVETGDAASGRLNEFFKMNSMNAKEWANLKSPMETLIKLRESYQQTLQQKGRGTATDILDEIGDSASECRKALELTNAEFNRLVVMGTATAVNTNNITDSINKFKELFEIGERFLVGIVNRIMPAFTSMVDEWFDSIVTTLEGGKGKEGLTENFRTYINTWSDRIFKFLMDCLDMLQVFLVKLNSFMDNAMKVYNEKVAPSLGMDVVATYDESKLQGKDKEVHSKIKSNDIDYAVTGSEHAKAVAAWQQARKDKAPAEEVERLMKAAGDWQVKLNAATKEHVELQKETIRLNNTYIDDRQILLKDASAAQQQEIKNNQIKVQGHQKVKAEIERVQDLLVKVDKKSKQGIELDARLKLLQEREEKVKASAEAAQEAIKNSNIVMPWSQQPTMSFQNQKEIDDRYSSYDVSDGGAAGFSSKVGAAANKGALDAAAKLLEEYTEKVKEQRTKIADFIAEKNNQGMDETLKREAAERKALEDMYKDLNKTVEKYYQDKIKAEKKGSAKSVQLQKELQAELKKNQEQHDKDMQSLALAQEKQRIKEVDETNKAFAKKKREIEKQFQFSGTTKSVFKTELESLEESLDDFINAYAEKHAQAIKDVNSLEYKEFQKLQEDKLKIIEQYNQEALNRYYSTMTAAHTAGQAMALSKGKGESPFPGMSNDDVANAKDNVNQQEQFMVQSSDNLVDYAAKNNKKMFEMKKKMDIANAIMSTYSAANKALEWGGPMGYVMAAMTIAQGLINVKTIQSQEWQGQAHSGIDYVPNEGTWNLAKGERVVGAALNEDLTRTLSVINSGGLQGSKGLSISAPMHIEGNVVDEGWFDSKLKAHRDSIAGLVSEYNDDRGI
ncbi:hypothetical protein PVL96_00330 [Aeromonas hydrophila]|uniref:hypothetical protein n=1 Tax=Aeromonas hydrophila TaxID=644 RepID=UPI0023789556|nr:hypothetical protein [Aeromonas hydrophila]MDD9223480.1 hypothetical protein [Aeromonas hydrophila]